MLTLAREGAPFSPVERELVEHLAAQSELALENLELGELMRRTEAELRAILEAVADAVVVEDAAGRVVYRNPAADALLGDRPDLACTLSVSADLLPVGWCSPAIIRSHWSFDMATGGGRG